MEKDKIAILLNNWSKTQQLRMANMTKFRVRVTRENQTVYGTMKLLKRRYIIFDPDDKRIHMIAFDKSRLTECKEIGTHGIKLIRRRPNQLPIEIFFANTKYRSAALQSIRHLISDESTDSSSEEEEERLPLSPPSQAVYYDKI